MLAVVLAVLGAGGTACSRSDARSAHQILAEAVNATVHEVDGRSRPGVRGERLRRGASVATDATGSATLEVDGRRVLLAPATVVRIIDGATVDVRRGRLLVDRRSGPDLTVAAGGLTVDEFRTAAVRIERGLDVRVGVLTGQARLTTSTERTLDVPALRQVLLAGSALPDAAAPLVLWGDEWERRVIPGVVTADEFLNRLARNIDTGVGTAVRAATVVPAAAAAAAAAPVGSPASEVLLPVAIARAATGGPAPDRERFASDLRRAGGSWGVVTTLAGARALAVVEAVSAMLTTVAPGEEPPIIATGPLAPATGGELGSDGATTGGAASDDRTRRTDTSGGHDGLPGGPGNPGAPGGPGNPGGPGAPGGPGGPGDPDGPGDPTDPVPNPPAPSPTPSPPPLPLPEPIPEPSLPPLSPLPTLPSLPPLLP